MKLGTELRFKKCCAEEIKKVWLENGGSMNVVSCNTNCPKCKQFIGLTQTNKIEANEFLNSFGIK